MSGIMLNDDGERESDLSTPPGTPDSPPPQSNNYNNAHSIKLPDPDLIKNGGEKSALSTSNNATVRSKSASSSTTIAPKKPRKKKDPTSTTIELKFPKDAPKTRKPRAPSAAQARKKQKSECVNDKNLVNASVATRQTKLVPDVASDGGTSQSQLKFNVQLPAASSPSSLQSQNRNNEAIPSNSLAFLGPGQTLPRTTGQNYDPIRSATIHHSPTTASKPSNVLQSSPVKSANRASASPSISSLIDPPNVPSPAYPLRKTSPPTSTPTSTPLPAHPSKPPMSDPSPPQPRSSPLPIQPLSKPPSTSMSPTVSKPTTTTASPTTFRPEPSPTAMDIDTDTVCPPPSKPLPSKKSTTDTSTGPSSTAPSPKLPRPKEPPRLPPGNGLLTSSLFGGPSDSSTLEKSAPTVILHVPLNGEINKYINFARMAEERYGFDALHPRLAAQRERLARVAALGAALENAGKANVGSGGQSPDEMSVDLSEGEGGEGEGSNVEMGGMTGEDGADKAATVQPRKRKMKEDMYDKDDPFVDDSELAWEEQAAASKDGFFVYSGPLVPEGEKPTVERADGTPKRTRGRGSGRGTTSTRGSGASRGGATSGGTTGTRGNATTRKPRVTKAARALMEQEKNDREKMAVLVAKPTGYQASG